MKKSLCMLLVFVMLSMLILSVSAAETDATDIGAALHTQAEAIAWAKDKADNHRTVGDGWCSALASGYIYYLTGSYLQVNGKDYATNYPSGWTPTKYYSGYVPQAGDLVVYDYSARAWVDGVQCGHVGIVYSANSSSFTSIEQNVDGRYTQYCYNRTYNNSNLHVWGFVRPNFKSDVPKPSNAWIKEAHTSIPTGTSNTFTFGATNASWYNIRIDKDGALWKFEQGISSGKSYTFADEGNYTVFIAGYNSAGYADSSKLSFTVFEPVLLGRDFVAEITNSKAAKNLSADSNDNVILQNKSDSDYQKWHFKLQSDNTYKITNVATNKNLDVYNADTANGTNIQIWKDNNTAAQYFYIRYNNAGFGIIPKANTSAAIDIANGYTDNGTNIQEWNWNASNAQTFSVDGYYDTTPANTSSFNGHTYECYDIETTWNQAYRICENKGGHLVTITSKDENDFVYDLCKDHCNIIWIGATVFNRDANKENWYWITGEFFFYENWNSGEPNCDKGIERYGEMFINTSNVGSWNDVGINSTTYFYGNGMIRGFVCEYDNGDVSAEEYSASKTITQGDKKYDVFDYRVDWQTAEAICEAKGGHLVKIDNAEENQLVSTIMAQGSMDEYWIDATDRISEGIWTDHEGNLLTYTNWASGEPNNDFNAEQYGFRLKSSDQWADLKGYSPMYRNTGFICEYEPKESILGDADGDGDVTSVDVTMIQRYDAKLPTGVDEETLMNADVDGNGIVEIIDATIIQRHLAQIATPYAIGEKKK